MSIKKQRQKKKTARKDGIVSSQTKGTFSNYVSRDKRYLWGTVTIVLIMLSTILTNKKIKYMSADPVSPKDCEPITRDTGDADISTKKPSIKLSQSGGTVNDASCLNRTKIYGIVQIETEEDIKDAVDFAKKNRLKVSVSGVKHSMGGHAFAINNLVLDISRFNQIQLNEDKKTVTVQSGATWHDIQNEIHPKYAVKAMQSSDIFTVGGSISVNAHGMDHNIGSVSNTIKKLRVLTPSGEIKELTKSKDKDLFNLVVGGYGLFGIILDAEIDITENSIYERERFVVDIDDLPSKINEIKQNSSYKLFYSHLSTSPLNFFDEALIYAYKDTEEAYDVPDKIPEVENTKLRRFTLSLAKNGKIGQTAKWFAEKKLEPMFEDCIIPRNTAMKEGENCLTYRNYPMHDSVKYIQNDHLDETDILHEYFVPAYKLSDFLSEAKPILQGSKLPVLNASVRIVHKEDVFLTYSDQEMYSLVLYINQKTDLKGNKKMAKLTSDMIELTHKHGGRFFLPYQLHYSTDQLKTSYPQIDDFWKLKRKYDPNELLVNTWYKKYGIPADETS